jgi:hypothetical protein
MARLSPPSAVVWSHLHRLTGPAGVFEHARHDRPRPGHGCCVDDAARVLVVASREPAPDDELQRLARQCLEMCLAALARDGRAHNRRDLHGRWVDRPGLGDWWGRAVWGLGCVAAHGDPRWRREALDGMASALRQRSPDRRAMAFAALGAAEVLAAGRGPGCGSTPDRVPGPALWALLEDAAEAVGCRALGRRKGWPWPEPRLTYANAVLPEAMLALGSTLGRAGLVQEGLDLLAWLLDVETLDGRLSVTPVRGRGPGEPGPAYDQQPIEVACLADACARARDLTTDPWWHQGVELAWGWFAGHNDVGLPLLDPQSGAGYDGLTATGRNDNRGAESTLAAISVTQHAVRPTLAG